MSDKIYDILGELEVYDLDKFSEELYIFLMKNELVGTFSIDFNESEKK